MNDFMMQLLEQVLNYIKINQDDAEVKASVLEILNKGDFLELLELMAKLSDGEVSDKQIVINVQKVEHHYHWDYPQTTSPYIITTTPSWESGIDYGKFENPSVTFFSVI